MTDDLHPAVAALAAAALAYYLIRWVRTPPSPDQQGGPPANLPVACCLLAALGTAAGLGWTPVYLRLDTALGVPNAARLLQHILILLAATAAQTLLLVNPTASAPRSIGSRWTVALGAAAALSATFGAGNFSREAPTDFTAAYATSLAGLSYWLIYLATLTFAVLDIIALSLRCANSAGPTLLRLGVRLFAAAGSTGMLYVADKIAYIACRYTGRNLLYDEPTVARLCLAASVAFIVTGLVLPSAGATLNDVRHGPRRRRLYRDLHPLWLELFLAFPEISLNPPRRPDRERSLNIVGTYRRLYRRVIEIRDGLRALAPYMDPAVRDAAQERPVEGRAGAWLASAAAEAATIAAALRAKSAGEPPYLELVDTTPTGAGSDADSDALWLAAVSRALAAPDPSGASSQNERSHAARNP